MHIRVKVKFALERATKAQRSTGIALSLTSALDGVGGQRHSPTGLPPGKKLGTHSRGGRVDPRASLNGCGKSPQHRDFVP